MIVMNRIQFLMNSIINGLFALLLILPASTGQASELLVMGTNDGYPKYFTGQHGEARGFIVDIASWCLDEMAQPYRIELQPWARVYNRALAAEGAIIGLSKTTERLAIFDYSDPMYTEHIVVLVKRGREFSFSGIADLRGRSIGVARGTSYGDEFNRAVDEGVFTIAPHNELRNGLAMLQANHIDVILLGSSVDIAAIAKQDKRLKAENFVALPNPLKSDSKFMGIHKSLKKQDFLLNFNKCLQQGQKKGIFERFMRNYVQENSAALP